MIELLAAVCGILAVLLVIAVVYAASYRAGIGTQAKAAEILSNRITVLKMDVDERDRTIDQLRKVNTDLHRENGRLKAEQVAAKPKRGPNGKFVKKAPKPVACG